MSSILPLRSEPQTGNRDPRVVDLDGDEADAVFSALSSDTARQIIAALHREPKTQSDIADAIDTSVQNVRYHLDNLEEAGLVEVVDTWYSSRGNEMKVYAPADAALIVSGDEGRASRLKAALSRLVGGVGVVALASLVIQTVATSVSIPDVGFGSAGGAGDGADDAAAPTGTDSEGADETVEDVSGGDGGGAPNEEAYEATSTTDAAAEDTTEPVTTAQETATRTETGDPGTTETVTHTTEVTATETTETAGNVTYHLREDELKNATLSDGNVTATDTVTGTTADPGTAETVVETTTAATAADGGVTAAGLPPGLAFFLGGVSVLVVVVALWYWSTY